MRDIFFQVSAVVKQCMEGAINLCVPLEVKMKSGPSWGSLTDYPIPLPLPYVTIDIVSYANYLVT